VEALPHQIECKSGLDMKRILALFIVTILVSACAPSAQAIQTAIAQTQAANPTPTVSPKLLALKQHLSSFLILNSDLPSNGQYHLFRYNPFSIPNKNVSSAYVEETGRVDGWEIYYTKISGDASAPQEIRGKVVLYQTDRGAQTSMNKYSDALVTDFVYLEEIQSSEIGDETRAFRLQYQYGTKGGSDQVSYWIEFSYRNIVEVIQIDGAENEDQLELASSIARLVLARLQASPLLNP
jgi:hypothetical protein